MVEYGLTYHADWVNDDQPTSSCPTSSPRWRSGRRRWTANECLASRSQLVTQELPKKRDVRRALPLLRPPMLVVEMDSGFVSDQREFPERA
jgi:hypothetical protein